MRIWIAAISVCLVMGGCAKSTVTQADVENLGKTHNEASYEEAMVKAGRGAELEEQKRIAAERAEQSGR